MTLGSWGELAAEKYLKKEGYIILERNYRCRIGELDIIALDGDCMVFVEVKTRQSQSFGLPCEAVHQEKIRHIKRTAAYYLMMNPYNDFDQRIDVLEILRIDAQAYLRHVKNITG
ncbi:YraN family protein [Anoxybacterium hadale]|uniref:YraN family protein n=1 Tax=Anoxybacterium hadale TaxID=3408580 RepID=A0ACD1A7Z2_9FIRM|nr:YraN family protein [Clostridiales bacterium]